MRDSSAGSRAEVESMPVQRSGGVRRSRGACARAWHARSREPGASARGPRFLRDHPSAHNPGHAKSRASLPGEARFSDCSRRMDIRCLLHSATVVVPQEVGSVTRHAPIVQRVSLRRYRRLRSVDGTWAVSSFGIVREMSNESKRMYIRATDNRSQGAPDQGENRECRASQPRDYSAAVAPL